ncbi:glutamate tRNA synthetase [Artemisia annua]|uniref:glutamate--tRNA ligase n=2 Tax=Artemisia annua TaxID=35608 RepID=A0A2U1MI15_ARTAN|nr:glutamate tRNA synthetase [Artemisia annua]
MATLAGIGMNISGGTRAAVPPHSSSSSSFILRRSHSYSSQTHRRRNTFISISENVPKQSRTRKCFSSISASSSDQQQQQQVRVRSKGGKFILRIEDTDLERSTKESEEAVLRDLSWLGLTWDEGPGAGGEYGPYRQSERNDLYKQYANKLLNSGQVYRCFCSNQELEQMKEIAKEKQLPPVYTGKWATATEEEVQEELAKGTPFTYRFRVPKEGSLKINDLIRGEVSWNLDTLGDFVVMRSNGQPVYNFCVTVDDATMAITHVIRYFKDHVELEQMKEIAKEKQLPPVYTGKWATATEEEVQEELEKGTPFTYRFRVPKEGSLKINDLIRGEVSWNLDTLGDFVVMRSNGQPVYNFCVTVDDATMAITHVIRAEEHLPNTLRQALIYKALGFPMPSFAHVSLILAPDRSKLSKRHGATSVGQYREMGFLPQAIVNYLALLGWSDGTNDEFFTLDQLVEKFSIDRVNKSGAIFDSTKLRWMNGLHLKALPTEELIKTIGEQWRSAGILNESEGLFIEDAYKLLEGGMNVITDAEKLMSDLLSYPFHDTLSSSEGRGILEDGLPAVAESLLAAYDSGELLAALEEGKSGWQKWVKAFGKSLKRKGKSLFMPLRVLLTGKLHGPDMGESIVLIYRAGTSGIVAPEVGFVTLEQRLKSLREVNWEAFSQAETATVAAP